MKDTKNNIRSFRYSDRVAQILESMEGDSLNAKFENLVLFCHDRLPEVQKKYDMYKSMADRQWNEFMELSDLRDGIKRDLRNVENKLCSLDELLEFTESRCKAVMEHKEELQHMIVQAPAVMRNYLEEICVT